MSDLTVSPVSGTSQEPVRSDSHSDTEGVVQTDDVQEMGPTQFCYQRVSLAARQECRGTLWGARSRFRWIDLECVDFGTKVFHRPFIQLVLAGGGVVAGALVEQTEKADGVHRPEFVGEYCDSLAVEVNGAGVSRGGAHEISGGGELDGIENRDGQVCGMLDCTAEELVIGG